MNEEQVASLIYEFAENVTTYAKNHIDKNFKINSKCSNELSERQFHILFSIEYLKQDTLSKLSSTLGLSASGLSTIVSKLMSGGYVTKNHFVEGTDGRMVIFEVSEKGRHSVAEATQLIIQKIEELYVSLNTEERTDFLKSYRQLRTLFNLEGFRDHHEAVEMKEFGIIILEGYILANRFSDSFFAKNFDQNGKQQSKVSVEQFRALKTIHDFGLDNLTALARCLTISESATSLTISKLSHAGYIKKEKTQGSGDARKMQFYITDLGVLALAEIDTILQNGFKNLYNSLDDFCKQQLCEGVSQLNNIFKTLNNREDFK